MKEWIKEIKKNRKRDISRIILKGNVYEISLVAFSYRVLNVDRF